MKYFRITNEDPKIQGLPSSCQEGWCLGINSLNFMKSSFIMSNVLHRANLLSQILPPKKCKSTTFRHLNQFIPDSEDSSGALLFMMLLV